MNYLLPQCLVSVPTCGRAAHTSALRARTDMSGRCFPASLLLVDGIARFGMRALMSSPGEITPYRRAPTVVVKTWEPSRNFFRYGRRMK